ncbi:MAG: HupE/UreJ family protein [Cyanobacteria bacterium P01_E01_bin.34]
MPAVALHTEICEVQITFTRLRQQRTAAVCSCLVATVAFGIATSPTHAHHPFGRELTATTTQGLPSGFEHPVIGLDYFVFTIAIGAIALGRPFNSAAMPAETSAFDGDSQKGWLAISTFLIAAVAGTAIHLQKWNLPVPELAISGSVFLLGILLLTRKTYPTAILAIVAALAGIFHDYAYGEAVVGAEPTPIAAYLFGFTAIEAALATASGMLVRQIQRYAALRPAAFHPAVALGGVVAGVGTFLLETVLA